MRQPIPDHADRFGTTLSCGPRVAMIAAFLVSCGGAAARNDGDAAGNSGSAGSRGTGGQDMGPGGAMQDGGALGGRAGAGGAGAGGSAGVVSATWRALPSLATKRQNAMGAAIDGTMYVMGGLNESGYLGSVERLQAGQAAWTAAPSLPNPLCCAAVGALGDVIALAGGYETTDLTPTNVLILFDTTTGVWRAGPPMPTARANAMGAVWDGRLMVIGGVTPNGATGLIEVYDPASDTWATSPMTVTPRDGGVAVFDTDRVYVIGGSLEGSLYGDAIVEVVAADGVSAGPPLALGRVQVTGGLLPSGLAVAGGWTAELATARAEGLFGARSSWQSLPPMPTSRAGAAAVVIDGALIVAGGGQFLGTSWVYQDAVEALRTD